MVMRKKWEERSGRKGVGGKEQEERSGRKGAEDCNQTRGLPEVGSPNEALLALAGTLAMQGHITPGFFYVTRLTTTSSPSPHLQVPHIVGRPLFCSDYLVLLIFLFFTTQLEAGGIASHMQNSCTQLACNQCPLSQILSEWHCPYVVCICTCTYSRYIYTKSFD